MNKKLSVIGTAMLLGFLSTACVAVHEGDKTFTVTAQKMIIGPGITDAEAKIPEGATITDVYVWNGILNLGLLQQAAISGTK